VADIRKEIDDLRHKMSKTSKRKDRAKFKEINAEIRSLRREAKQREDKVVAEVIDGNNVILCTCVGAGNHILKDKVFDCVVIDEAAQGLEACCWIPLLHTRSVCVLAGDHLQLPPTIKSKSAEMNGLGVTLFERLMQDPNNRFDDLCRLLDTQYRMNSLISDWASSQLYSGKLQSHQSVANHSLNDLLNPHEADGTTPMQLAVAGPVSDCTKGGIHIPVLLLLDTAGCDMDESDCQGGSHRNEYEADIVLKHVRMLVLSGVSPCDIGVITPYNGQLDLLKQVLLNRDASLTSTTSDAAVVDLEGVEVRTIDGFQGGEKECIILSLVRSNNNKVVGFLGDNRRINVAVTRARRHLCVICDSSTCGRDRFINSLLQHMSARGDHRSAAEYAVLDDPELWFAVDDGVCNADAVVTATGDISACAVSEGNDLPTGQTIHKARTGHKTKPKGSGLSTTVSKKSSLDWTPADTEQQNQQSHSLPAELETVIDDFVSGRIYGGVTKLAGNTIVLVEPIYLNTGVSNSLTGSADLRLLRFPSTLNSYHRMLIHERASKLGLQHRSLGPESSRFIEIATSAMAFKICDSSPMYAYKASPAAGTEGASSAGFPNSSSGDPQIPEQQTAGVERVAPLSQSRFAQLGDDGELSEGSEDGDHPLDTSVKKASKTSSKKKKKKTELACQSEQLKQQNLQKQSETPKFYVSEERQKAVSAIASAGSKKTDNEMEAVDAAIAANEALRNLNKYRIPAAPMPNHEKNMNKARLHEKLEAARKERAGNKEAAGSANTSSGTASAGGSRKTVLKKPPPNFGGGRLGPL
jgi:hypothetical protein